jgi:hypothetical protein
MGHYAYLDENNIVTQVIVGRDENDLVDGVSDWEAYYGAKRCSYNTYGGAHRHGGTPFRKNYPAVGFKYDSERDAFIPPPPYASWVLNEETCLWEAPVPCPEEDNGLGGNKGSYVWQENTLEWVFVFSDTTNGEPS